MLHDPIAPTLARLATPNVLAMVVQALISIAEGYFASRLGVDAWRTGIVFPLVMLTQMLSAGAIGGAVSSAVARALGADDMQRASGLVIAAWIVGLGRRSPRSCWLRQEARPRLNCSAGRAAQPTPPPHTHHDLLSGLRRIWLCHLTLSVVRGKGGMGFASGILLLVSLLTCLSREPSRLAGPECLPGEWAGSPLAPSWRMLSARPWRWSTSWRVAPASP